MNIESVLLALRNNCRWNPLMSCYFASSFLRRFFIRDDWWNRYSTRC